MEERGDSGAGYIIEGQGICRDVQRGTEEYSRSARRDVTKGPDGETGWRRLPGPCHTLGKMGAPSLRRRGRRVGGESQSRGGRKRTTDRAGVTGREPRPSAGYSRQGPVKFGGRVEHP